MWSSVASRLAKKPVRGTCRSAGASAASAACSRWLASRLACAWMRSLSPAGQVGGHRRQRRGSGGSERPRLQPALDLRTAVVAPERLAVDHEVRRAEDARAMARRWRA